MRAWRLVGRAARWAAERAEDARVAWAGRGLPPLDPAERGAHQAIVGPASPANTRKLDDARADPAATPAADGIAYRDARSADPDPDAVRRALDPRANQAAGKKGRRKPKEPGNVGAAGEGVELSGVEPGGDPAPGAGAAPAEQAAETHGYKMALIVRTDLGMGKGKAAAQCSHAALAAYKSLLRSDPALLEEWEDEGSPKIVLKVDSEAEMLARMAEAQRRGVVAKSILDAGRTQIAAGSRTVAAIGPARGAAVDEVCRGLKLF
ncbi:peptidyl-tRNA hydrolase PTH2-domain-containing protein [Hyaloraphidium curvatum]|nr:peptidyl-tRNA hydrolase PTH2-domain-containing protein [Hyaloraphidium curvatum]